MRLNANGDWLAGIAGVRGSVNGVEFSELPSGNWRWLRDNQIIGQLPDDPANDQAPWRLHTQRLLSGTVAPVDDEGADFLEASGTGAWAAMFGGWLRTSWGMRVPNMRPVAGAEGYIAVIADYQGGRGLSVFLDGDLVRAVMDAQSFANVSIRDGLLTWRDKVLDFQIIDILTGVRVPYLRRQDDVYWMTALKDSAGVVWLMECDYTCDISIRRADSWTAYRLVTYRPDAETYSPDIVRVWSDFRLVYSLTIGEPAPDVRVLDLTPSMLSMSSFTMYDTEHRRPPVVVPPPVVLPPIDLGPQRSCWLDDMSGQGFGNCGGSGHPAAVFEDARYVLPADEPKVVALIHGPFEQSDLARTIQMAIRLSVPVIFADDGHSVADMKPHRDALEAAGVRLWEGPSAYPGQGLEGTVDAVEARLDAKLATDLRPHALIFPGYAVNGQSEAVIAQSCLSVNRLKNKYPNIKQVAIFGLDRPRDPSLQLKWPRQFMVALTAQTPTPLREIPPVPPVVVPVPPDPPPVTTPKDRDRAQIASGVAAIVGGAIALWKWLRRKK